MLSHELDSTVILVTCLLPIWSPKMMLLKRGARIELVIVAGVWKVIRN